MAINFSGFRVDSSQLKRKLQLVRDNLRVDLFKPALIDYFRKTLNECVKLTPAREYQLIQRAQSEQYANRINYIPSIHWGDADPRLVVKSGVQWIFVSGKWYNAAWKLPPPVWATYQDLLAERTRRMQTSKTDFVKQRAQARFLYKKSWTQVGDSIGVDIRASGSIRDSVSRRKPPKAPPKGYAQIRGGKTTLNIVVYNPFLQEETAYWKDSGSAIMQQALPVHRPQFKRTVDRILKRAIYAIFKAHGG